MGSKYKMLFLQIYQLDPELDLDPYKTNTYPKYCFSGTGYIVYWNLKDLKRKGFKRQYNIFERELYCNLKYFFEICI